jgi:hypothetical protein
MQDIFEAFKYEYDLTNYNIKLERYNSIINNERK